MPHGILILIVAFMTSLSSSEDQKLKKGDDALVIGTGLSVRAKPTTEGKILFKLSHGSLLRVLSSSAKTQKIGKQKDYWYFIRPLGSIQKTEGWVFGAFLKKNVKHNDPCPGIRSSLPRKTNTADVKADRLRLRSQPGQHSRIITTLRKYDRVTILGSKKTETYKNIWYKIAKDKRHGWVAGCFLKSVKEHSKPPLPNTNEFFKKKHNVLKPIVTALKSPQPYPTWLKDHHKKLYAYYPVEGVAQWIMHEEGLSTTRKSQERLLLRRFSAGDAAAYDWLVSEKYGEKESTRFIKRIIFHYDRIALSDWSLNEDGKTVKEENSLILIQNPLKKGEKWRAGDNIKATIESLNEDINIGDILCKNCMAIKYKHKTKTVTRYFSPKIGCVAHITTSQHGHRVLVLRSRLSYKKLAHRKWQESPLTGTTLTLNSDGKAVLQEQKKRTEGSHIVDGHIIKILWWPANASPYSEELDIRYKFKKPFWSLYNRSSGKIFKPQNNIQ